MRVKTWRQLDESPAISDTKRALAILNYLNGIGASGSFPRRPVRLATQTYDLPTVPDDAWASVEIVVDDVPYDRKGVRVDDSWLALGIMEDFVVAIEAHGYDPDRLELVRPGHQRRRRRRRRTTGHGSKPFAA